jgi:hypothetical protein
VAQSKKHQVYALRGRSLAMIAATDLSPASLAMSREVTSHRAQTS